MALPNFLLVGAQKVNYLRPMVVAPQAHFHVLLRYANPASFGSATYADANGPGICWIDHALDRLSSVAAQTSHLSSAAHAG